MSEVDKAPEKPKRSSHREARTTGEWVKEQIPASVLTLFAAREEQNDKKDSRVLYIVAGFGLLGWLGFLILGGHEIVTRVNAQTGEVDFRANGSARATEDAQ